MVPVLLCSGCGRKVLLPYRRFVKSSVLEPYWPSPDRELNWVCDACGRYSAYVEEDLRWEPEDGLPSPPADRGFWRVEIACATPGCPSSIVANTQTFGRTSRRNLGLMVSKASPTPVCEADHAIAAECSYPQRIDFVEWSGAEDYLV